MYIYFQNQCRIMLNIISFCKVNLKIKNSFWAAENIFFLQENGGGWNFLFLKSVFIVKQQKNPSKNRTSLWICMYVCFLFLENFSGLITIFFFYGFITHKPPASGRPFHNWQLMCTVRWPSSKRSVDLCLLPRHI